MTKDLAELLPVTQADRDAAWPFAPSCYKEADREHWLDGRYDSVPVIQAFARHRAQARADALEEARLAFANASDSSECENCHDLAWRQGLEAIRSLSATRKGIGG